MPNTFLQTNRAIQATSNPQQNVNNVSNQNTPQVQQNTAVPQTQQASNPINPITIPIQIQPEIAQPNNQVQNNTNTSLQRLQQNTNNTNAAPTPQAYNPNNTNNNVVDFNQIYSSYQNNFGNNQQTSQNSNIGASGIKKTSVGSTIVTPTVSNINSVEGQYQSAYSDTINSLISEMLSQMNNGFQYDPSQDAALKLATEYAANSTMQSLAGSGVLNSSSTAERVARVVSELIPQYEEKAHDRWIEYLGNLADTAQLVMNYDSQQFEYWKDAKDREFQNKQFEYQKAQDEITNAWKRVDELGYVDNEAAKVLGVPVGTLSGEARLAKEQQEFELKKMREQLEIQYENDKALYKLRNELDKEMTQYEYQLKNQSDRELAQYEYQLKNEYDKDMLDYEYQLQQKYGLNTSSSSSSGSNLSTYQDIINNRYANYDDFTKRYTIDTADKEAAWNYVTNEYAAGRLNDNDYAYLVAMYDLSEPTEESKLWAERAEYLRRLDESIQ